MWFYPISGLSNPSKSFLKLYRSKIIFDETGKAKEFIKSISELFSDGPEALDEEEIEHLYYWLRSMISRLGNNSIDSLYRRNLLLIELLEAYFSINRMWFLGSKYSESWLKTNEPIIYETLKKAMSPFSSISDIDTAIKVIFDRNN